MNNMETFLNTIESHKGAAFCTALFIYVIVNEIATAIKNRR